ncbi:MAG: flagellar filament outer layer protein FlaA [Brevinema sp.]
MKKQNNLLVLLFVLLAVPLLYSQDQAVDPATDNQTQTTQPETVITPQDTTQTTANLPVIENDPEVTNQNIGAARTAEEILQTILLDDFEVPQGWKPSIPLDFGISRSIYREGGPQEIITENNKMTLGVKTFFFKRNFGWMSIDKNFPIDIKNIVRSFSVWVVGRNRTHKLYIKVRDLNNDHMRLPAGEMKWRGWKKVIVPVSDSVIQNSAKHNNKGLDFFGFHVSFNAEDILVSEPYFLYFDYLTATVNMGQQSRVDDMIDDW